MLDLQARERLLKDAVILRGATPSGRQDAGLGDVRFDLERLVGPTVSRAMAARALGVSQTAFDRRLRSGDVPFVVTPAGRREIPVPPLVDLVSDVERQRRRDPDDPHPLASVLRERRARAEALDAERVLPSRYRRRSDRFGHRRAELQALAYHRVVAARLNESLVEDARRRTEAWRSDGKMDPRYADRWDRVLAGPVEAIKSFMSRDTQEARDLRQNSPFAGLLSEPERRRVLDIATSSDATAGPRPRHSRRGRRLIGDGDRGRG